MDFFLKGSKTTVTTPFPLNEGDDVYDVATHVGKPLTLEKLKQIEGFERGEPRPGVQIIFVNDMISREKPKESYNEVRKKMEPIGNGIFKKTISKGFGDTLKKDLQVTVHFTIMFEFTEKVSNSTFNTGRPFSFIIGTENDVIPGFEQAVMSMKNQEVAHFVIPHQLLYGTEGWPPKIPAGQDSFLIIEIVKVSEAMSDEDKIRLHNNFSLTMSKVEEMRGKAKIASNAKFHQVAADHYCEAIILLQDVLTQSVSDNEKRLETLVNVLFEAGIAYDKLEHFDVAIKMYMEAVILHQKGVKIPNSLRGKIYLHAARGFRKIDHCKEGFLLLTAARTDLGFFHRETEAEYQAFYEDYKNDVAYDEVAKRVEDVYYDKPELHRNKATVRATLDHMVKSFTHTNENSRTIFGFQCDNYNREANAVATTNKIKLDVQKIPNGTTRYLLTLFGSSPLDNVFTVKPYIGKPLVAEKLNQLASHLSDIRNSYECMFVLEMLTREKPQESYNELQKKMEPLENGIFKKTISEGFGDPLQPNMQVTVHFTLMFESEKQVQDSTYCACKPFTFLLGTRNGVLPGFEQAVLSMKNQEKAHFVVPHKLLYGRQGWPPLIAPNENGYLIIEIARVTEFISEKDKIRLHNNFNQIIAKAEEIRERAKLAFNAKFYQAAADMYHEAVTLLKDVLAQNAVDNDKRLELLVMMYLYGGMAHLKQYQASLGVKMLLEAVDLVDKGVKLSNFCAGKLYYQSARALRMRGDLGNAYLMLLRTKDVLNNAEIEEEYDELYKGYKCLYFKIHMNVDQLQKLAYDTFNEERRDKEFVQKTFEEMFRNFESTNEKSRTIIGFQYDIGEIKAMAAKRGIKVKVQKFDNGTTRYLLIKK
ncbi:hypothetical protein DMENIID0001_032000 [Sergentomyia squamirostris]